MAPRPVASFFWMSKVSFQRSRQNFVIVALGPVYTMLAVLLCPKLRQSRRAERSLVTPNERPACSRQASNAEWRSLGHNPKGLACFAPQLRCQSLE